MNENFQLSKNIQDLLIAACGSMQIVITFFLTTSSTMTSSTVGIVTIKTRRSTVNFIKIIKFRMIDEMVLERPVCQRNS
jgi:hypothetical protein